MRKKLGQLAYKLFLAMGYEVRLKPPVDKFKWLKGLGIDTILDIGANTGQFAEYIHAILPDARIYSFEPLKDCFDLLVNNNRGNSKFKAFNVALSDENGIVEFHRSSFSQSSSLLPMGQLHKDNFPFTAGEEIVTVKAARLDDFASEMALGDHILIKLDVQGVEEKVIRGGANTLRRADVVFLETNFQELYEGQPLFKEILDIMYAEGFRYLGNAEGHLLSPVDGSCLEEDSIFVNARLTTEKGVLKQRL
jgi:FkbM family methyltransferase